MKLEVGKKYVDGHGNVVEISSVHGENYVGVDEEYKDAFVYDEKGIMYQGHVADDNLLKEYTPPRPDVEVLGDAICYLYVFLDDLRGEYGSEKWKAVKAVVKEAEEMKKRMESK